MHHSCFLDLQSNTNALFDRKVFLFLFLLFSRRNKHITQKGLFHAPVLGFHRDHLSLSSQFRSQVMWRREKKGPSSSRRSILKLPLKMSQKRHFATHCRQHFTKEITQNHTMYQIKTMIYKSPSSPVDGL